MLTIIVTVVVVDRDHLTVTVTATLDALHHRARSRLGDLRHHHLHHALHGARIEQGRHRRSRAAGVRCAITTTTTTTTTTCTARTGAIHLHVVVTHRIVVHTTCRRRVLRVVAALGGSISATTGTHTRRATSRHGWSSRAIERRGTGRQVHGTEYSQIRKRVRGGAVDRSRPRRWRLLGEQRAVSLSHSLSLTPPSSLIGSPRGRERSLALSLALLSAPERRERGVKCADPFVLGG